MNLGTGDERFSLNEKEWGEGEVASASTTIASGGERKIELLPHLQFVHELSSHQEKKEKKEEEIGSYNTYEKRRY